jgi:hypothetical protein
VETLGYWGSASSRASRLVAAVGDSNCSSSRYG